jgi:chemotaxis-related protein WspB
MLLLCFEVDNDVYGLPVQALQEVLPVVSLKLLPGAPAAVAGLMNFRQRTLPVIDVHQMLTGRRAADRLNTRILVAQCPAATSSHGLIGLMVERATHTVSISEGEFRPAPVRTEGTPYLGPVAEVDGRLLQRVEVVALLTPEIQDALARAKSAEES